MDIITLMHTSRMYYKNTNLTKLLSTSVIIIVIENQNKVFFLNNVELEK